MELPKSIPTLCDSIDTVLLNRSDFNGMLDLADVASQQEFPASPLDNIFDRIVNCIIDQDEQVTEDTKIPASVTKPISQALIAQLLNSLSCVFETVENGSCDCMPMGYGQISICPQCKPFGKVFSATRLVKATPTITLPKALPSDITKTCIMLLKERKRSNSEEYVLKLFEQKEQLRK